MTGVTPDSFVVGGFLITQLVHTCVTTVRISIIKLMAGDYK